jgi:hypothetical protein
MDEPWATIDSQDLPWPGLGGSHHLPFIVYSMLGHGTSIQMAFCPETPKWESQNTQSWDSRNFGDP